MARAQSQFDRITGTNEYQRQSWRDSYNSGRAAGDWTGGVNARLDDERSRFQGATEGGSSTQPSGLQLAQMIGAGVGYRIVANGSAGHGPGAPMVVVGGSMGGGSSPVVNTSGPGGGGVVTGKDPVAGTPGDPFNGKHQPKKITQLVIGGNLVPVDKGWSNAADAEDRWGEAEFLSPTWFYAWGVTAADGWKGTSDWIKDQSRKGSESLSRNKPTAQNNAERYDILGAVTGVGSQLAHDVFNHNNSWNPNGNRGAGTGTLTGGGF